MAIVYTTPERHDVACTAYYYYTKHARGILNR